ncbi:MAG TPA: DUF2381 family protein [Archangium sp.]|uniref:DUF2381 family protein n=1 Tax=Archangium sp. TaxID=1872627 RepID=UPI002E363312|nr:DUF2381 family protein [Archangium sp.]HEX5748125.1 DUF2381 family protein [Archangium sp.]
MLPPAPPSLLALVLLHGSPMAATPPPAPDACEDSHRVELAPGAVVPEVCVSPGLLTGFFFDAPAVVELQDESRFAQVLRGPRGFTFIPPPDMTPGERLRLTVHWGEGLLQQSATFSLVAHPRQATRQVEVFRDQRPRESVLQEAAQERAKNEQLRVENRQLRAGLDRVGKLQGLYASGALGEDGIKAIPIPVRAAQPGDGALLMTRGSSYRSEKTVAVAAWVMNAGTDSWLVAGASLVLATGEKLEGVTIAQPEAIAPGQTWRVFIEADVGPGAPSEEVTLQLWDAAGRTLSIPKVTFP